MDKQNNNQHNNHGNGFVLGVIVGVAITLLFTTKRGRDILHDITEKGIKKFSDLEDLSKEMENEEFYDEALDDQAEDYQKTEKLKKPINLAKEEDEAPKQPKSQVEKDKVPSAATSEAVETKKSTEKPEKTITGRRWFRGLRKKG